MALIQRTNPEGIDIVIGKLQNDLFLELTNTHGWTNYESYDRAYRNKKGEDTLPEVYTKKGDYEEVLFNDKFTVTSFFLADEKRTLTAKESKFEQGASFIVQANLKKLFPAMVHRGDEEMIDDVIKSIKRRFWDERLADVITGVDNVYTTLKIGNKKKYWDDISYYAIARFNFRLLYTNTKCSTEPIK